MRVLITGMNGTVAPALAEVLRAGGAEMVRWDRATMPASSEGDVRGVMERARADWVCHIATGAPEWAEWIARACTETVTRLLWTGTVSVFDESVIRKGPLTPETMPDATDDYGRYKIECEKRVLAACPSAVVARLGWQIGVPGAPGNGGLNTMTNYLMREAGRGGGTIEASAGWVPSCAFLSDSASAMAALMSRGEAGVYHVEGNAGGLSLFEIATGLARLLKLDWLVRAAEAPVRDNRMHDERVSVGQVPARLARD